MHASLHAQVWYRYISALSYQQESELDYFAFQHTPLLATRLRQVEKVGKHPAVYQQVHMLAVL
jgi:hypothetical protein